MVVTKQCYVDRVPHERKKCPPECECWCHTRSFKDNWGWEKDERKRIKFS